MGEEVDGRLESYASVSDRFTDIMTASLGALLIE
jgi:hypothetical protein